MKKRIAAFLDNDSTFGQIMGKCWLLIAANLMFLVFSIPVITIGPALAGLFHVCLRSLRSQDEISPVREFWKGFRGNFRQALIVWLIFLAAAFLVLMDIRITVHADGGIGAMRYLFYLMAGVGILLILFIYPVMAAFSDTLPHLARNAVFFIARNPVRAVGAAALAIGPMIYTYMDLERLPLYAFLWTLTGFSGIAMLISRMLIRDFEIYLPDKNKMDPEAGKKQELK